MRNVIIFVLVMLFPVCRSSAAATEDGRYQPAAVFFSLVALILIAAVAAANR